MARMPAITRPLLIRIGLIALQWVMLTLALGAVIVYSADSLQAFLSPNLDGSLIFVGAFVAALLLGMSIDSFKVLVPLTFLMCFGASMVFVAVLFSPTFVDVTVRTNALENYAATRVFLFMVLMFLPAVVGAGLGNFLGGYVGDNVFGPEEPAMVDNTSWYEQRRAAMKTEQEPQDRGA
jgi:hypothetical protein